MCKRRRKGGPCPLPVQPEAGEQLTWHFQTRAEEAGATGLSQHIGGAGAKRLAQLVSRTGLSQRETRSGRRGCEPPNGDGGGGGPSQKDGCQPLLIPYLAASLDMILAAKATRPILTLPLPPPPGSPPISKYSPHSVSAPQLGGKVTDAPHRYSLPPYTQRSWPPRKIPPRPGAYRAAKSWEGWRSRAVVAWEASWRRWSF